MGQQEIYDFLRRNGGTWFTSRALSDKLGISIGSVTMSLKKLRKTNIIEFRKAGPRNTFEYCIKRN